MTQYTAKTQFVLSGILSILVTLFIQKPAYALSTGNVLTFEPMTMDNGYHANPPPTGSWFMVHIDSGWGNTEYYTSLSSLNGIVLGSIQPASGSQLAFALDGNESPDIDTPWQLLDFTGMHQTTAAPTVFQDNGNGTFLLDFSGWGWDARGHDTISLGSDSSNFPDDTGLATLICSSVECTTGDTYSLDYFTHVPLDDTSIFAGISYQLHLEGTVSYVPAPPALLLISSGALALFGYSRRHGNNRLTGN